MKQKQKNNCLVSVQILIAFKLYGLKVKRGTVVPLPAFFADQLVGSSMATYI